MDESVRWVWEHVVQPEFEKVMHGDKRTLLSIAGGLMLLVVWLSRHVGHKRIAQEWDKASEQSQAFLRAEKEKALQVLPSRGATIVAGLVVYTMLGSLVGFLLWEFLVIKALPDLAAMEWGPLLAIVPCVLLGVSWVTRKTLRAMN